MHLPFPIRRKPNTNINMYKEVPDESEEPSGNNSTALNKMIFNETFDELQIFKKDLILKLRSSSFSD